MRLGPPRFFSTLKTTQCGRSRARTAGHDPATNRWSRRRAPTERAAPSFEARLSGALTATAELEHLLGAVPVLADPSAFSTALVRDVSTRLEADTVGLWRCAEPGWHAAAHVGFTPHERRWKVADDQPLLQRLQRTGGALLVDPVERAPEAVAGLPGAHTTSLLAVALTFGPGRYGVLVVGRDIALTPTDLDVLVDLAREAAPGLAVSEHLQRLGALIAGRAVDAAEEG